MGERRNGACRVEFDRALRVEFHGVKVTSEAGLLAYRELDDVFGGLGVTPTNCIYGHWTLCSGAECVLCERKDGGVWQQ